MMRALMVQGCTSSAGKSLLATVLCRHFSRRGVRVAPFKGQNMSNHARVGEGGEMGAAQYLQALAARVTPDVRMNPVLVKPEGERASTLDTVQVAVDAAELEPECTRERTLDPAPCLGSGAPPAVGDIARAVALSRLIGSAAVALCAALAWGIGIAVRPSADNAALVAALEETLV